MIWDSLWSNTHLISSDSADDLKIIRDGAIGVTDGKIAWIGKQSELSAKPELLAKEHHDLQGWWLTPGFLDCHTHLVYSGNRAHEFALRLQGKTYTEIARAGGGILSTVNATRSASEQQLFAESLERLNALVQQGVTTVEIKSGYGLDLENERKILNVARQLAKATKLDVINTFLGAHTIPLEYKENPDDYVKLLCEFILPTLAREKLIDQVDAFCDKTAFNVEQTKKIFQSAKDLQLPIKLHADQLSEQGGAELAAHFSALSADHLEHATEKGIAMLAKTGTVAVLLPGAFYFLREKKMPPIELLRQHKVPIAIATDCNPGTSPTTSLTLMLNMACILFNLTPTEAILGVTRYAAQALGLQRTHGTLAIGKIADFAVWNIQSPEELCYHVASSTCKKVIKKGKILVSFN